MAEQDSKGVYVYPSQNGSGSYYKDGVKIGVIDGHLHVLAAGGVSIAVFAPEKWHNAEVRK